MTGKTFTTTELDALEDEFDHRTWGPESEEPDARVTVLYDEADQGVARWLVRVGTGWSWASPYGDPADPDPWDAIQRWLDRSPGRKLRIPDRTELVAGGWTIEDQRAQPGEAAEPDDEAKAQIDEGFRMLDVPDLHKTGRPERRAQTHFLASIAISLYDLVNLHRKYDPDNMELVMDTGSMTGPGGLPVEDQDFETKAAAEPEGKPAPGAMGNEDFPYAR